MAAALRARAPYARQVFLNCPYDDEYRPLLKAVVFAVHACEFKARPALEEPGSERLRLERLVSLIGACRVGIHDLSRVRRRGRRRCGASRCRLNAASSTGHWSSGQGTRWTSAACCWIPNRTAPNGRWT